MKYQGIEKEKPILRCPACGTTKAGYKFCAICGHVQNDDGWITEETFEEIISTPDGVRRSIELYSGNRTGFWIRIAENKYPDLYTELKPSIDAEKAEDLRKGKELIEEMHRKYPHLYAGRKQKEAVKV